jgi:CubicO group peptidase (beta-lactamase class C family)
MNALDVLADWPVPTVAAAVIGPSGVLTEFGDQRHQFQLASVTKPLVARAAHVAVEEGVLDLDTPAGPPGSTVRHLLAHASGLSMNSADLMAEPGKRRVYSNYGFEVLAETIQDRAGIEFSQYLHEAVFEPLSMVATQLDGGARAAGYGVTSTVDDLARFASDLLRPLIVAPETHAEATTV